jgi:acetylglutamate kinase
MIEADSIASPVADASALIGALRGRTVVVKYGGAAMGGDDAERLFARDAARLARAGVRLVVVHGGGNEVTALASKLGIEAEFVGGHRRTSSEMLDVVTMMLAGKVNKNLVRLINVAGGEAVGICGVDSNLLVARRMAGADLGHVGEVAMVNKGLLDLLLANGMTPVVAPVAIGEDGELYNINADLAAGGVAAALGADSLIYMSNIAGIEANGSVIAEMSSAEANELIASGVINGGMIPKITSALDAINAGVGSVRIVDGRLPHALMTAIVGDGGTKVREE